jgi:hypothetical protein
VQMCFARGHSGCGDPTTNLAWMSQISWWLSSWPKRSRLSQRKVLYFNAVHMADEISRFFGAAASKIRERQSRKTR